MLGEAHIATKAVARCHVDGYILQWLVGSRSSGGSWGELKVQKGLEVRNRQTGTGPNGQRRRIVEATPRGGLVQQGLDGQGRTWKRWPLGGAGEPTAARSYEPSWHEWGAESGPSMDSRCGKGWHILCPVCESGTAGTRMDSRCEGRRGGEKLPALASFILMNSASR